MVRSALVVLMIVAAGPSLVGVAEAARRDRSLHLEAAGLGQHVRGQRFRRFGHRMLPALLATTLLCSPSPPALAGGGHSVDLAPCTTAELRPLVDWLAGKTWFGRRLVKKVERVSAHDPSGPGVLLKLRWKIDDVKWVKIRMGQSPSESGLAALGQTLVDGRTTPQVRAQVDRVIAQVTPASPGSDAFRGEAKSHQHARSLGKTLNNNLKTASLTLTCPVTTLANR